MNRLTNISRFFVILLLIGGLAAFASTARGQIRSKPSAPVVVTTPPPDDSSAGSDDTGEIVWDPDSGTDVTIPIPPGLVLAVPSSAPPAPAAKPAVPAAQPAAPAAVTPAAQAAPVATPAAQPAAVPQQPAPAPAPSPPSPAPASSPQVVTVPAPKTPAVVTTPSKPVAAPTVAKTEPVPLPPPPPPPPPPLCLNYPEWTAIPGGWQKAKDGTCNKIPTLDLRMPGPNSVNAPGGVASFTLTITNMGDNVATGSAFRLHLDGSLTLASPIATSEGEGCGNVDTRTYACPIGTIAKGQTVSVTIKTNGSGQATAYAEPGGEEDTDVVDDHLTITVVPTVLQTQLSVQQHGLQWGGHWYRDPQTFARILAREGGTWKGWKKNHLALAKGLVAHNALARRRK